MTFEEQVWRALPVVVLILQGVIGWGVWSLRSQFQTIRGCENLRAKAGEASEKEHDAVDCRLMDLEKVASRIELLPTSREIAELSREVADLRGGQKAMEQAIKSLGISLDRLERPINMLLEHSLEAKK